MANLNSALNLYAGDQGGSFGNASTTYISIPDPLATSTAGDQCQGLGLPLLIPTSTTYHCAASSTFRNTNGTGWIPINFANISFGSPLSVLPIDPMDVTSSGEYYSYLLGSPASSTYELIARMESAKYASSQGAAANDGGYSNQYEEVGKDLTLGLVMAQNLDRVPSTDYLAFDQTGLVGFWPLNEGTGSNAKDQSGGGNNGSWIGTGAGTSGYYSPGLGGGWAGNFDGSTNYINLSATSLATKVLNKFSISLWVKNITLQGGQWPAFVGFNEAVSPWGIYGESNSGYSLVVANTSVTMVNASSLSSGWNNIIATWDGANSILYVNGVVCIFLLGCSVH